MVASLSVTIRNMKPEALVGTWKLISAEHRVGNGEAFYPNGRDAIGQLIYTVDGFMSVSIMNANRRHFSTKNFLEAPDQEKLEAWNTIFSYCGRYSVVGDKIIHHVEVTSVPNREGTDMERIAKLEGKRLILTTPPFPSKDGEKVATIIWEKNSK